MIASQRGGRGVSASPDFLVDLEEEEEKEKEGGLGTSVYRDFSHSYDV